MCSLAVGFRLAEGQRHDLSPIAKDVEEHLIEAQGLACLGLTKEFC